MPVLIDTERLLSSADIAAELGVTERTVGYWRAKGYGPPYIELGPRLIRYRIEDVREWLANRSAA